MKCQSYYRRIIAFLACGCLFFFGAVLPYSTSLAFTSSTLATPRPTMVSTATPKARSTPTIITASQPSTHSTNPDPATAIAIIGLIIASMGLAVQAVTLILVYRYVRDTATMSQATRDSANATQASAKVAENTLQEMKEARDGENAPSVVVYFNYIHSRSQTLYLVVENIGKSVARDIQLKFTPDLQVSDFNKATLENNIVLKHGIRSLVPNYKISIPFDYLMQYILLNLPMEYTVKVTYWWKKSLPPQELEYVLDLSHYRDIHFVTETGLGEIDETLRKLESHFSNHSMIAESANILLNQIANAINRGLVIKNRISVSQGNADIPALLKEFVLLWVVDYGKQTEKWNKSFLFGLRAKAALLSEELLKSTVTLGPQERTEQLNHIIGNLSKLASMELVLDAPDGVIFSPLLFVGGSSREDFNNLGDNIVADIRTVIEFIEKEKEPLLNGDNKEAQLPTNVEEPD